MDQIVFLTYLLYFFDNFNSYSHYELQYMNNKLLCKLNLIFVGIFLVYMKQF